MSAVGVAFIDAYLYYRLGNMLNKRLIFISYKISVRFTNWFTHWYLEMKLSSNIYDLIYWVRDKRANPIREIDKRNITHLIIINIES